LDFTSITDKGVESLKGLPKLQELTFDSLDITDQGAETLASMPNLKSVDLYHTLVSEKGYEKIKAALPACQIYWEKDSALPTRRHL
jgi:hypothetical protein